MFEKSLDNFFVLAFSKINTWIETLATMLPNFILAAIVFTVFYISAHILSGVFKKTFSRFSDNHTITDLFSKILVVLIVAVGVFMALSILQLDKAVTSLLAGAGVIGLALGFAFQEIVSNFVAGILISLQKPYRVGDIIEVAEYNGVVKTIDLRVTRITTFQGLEVLIPNKQIYTSAMTNYTSTNDRRIDFEVGVSYGENLRNVTKIVEAALESVAHQTDKKSRVFFKEFGDSSINLVAHVWIEYHNQVQYLEASHDIVIKIKEAFDQNNITIPFPIRTLDFGAKGGTHLREELGRPSDLQT